MSNKKKNDVTPKLNPRSIEYWEQDKQLQKIVEWGSKGLALHEIATNMGVARQTLWKWRQRSTDIDNALHTGNKAILEILENALIRKALGYEREEVTFKYLEDGTRIPTKGRVIHYPPDTPALKYAMSNKSKGEWKDRIDYEDTSAHDKLDKLLTKMEEEAK